MSATLLEAEALTKHFPVRRGLLGRSLMTRGSPTIDPTRIRGSSDAYGSWNTACTARR